MAPDHPSHHGTVPKEMQALFRFYARFGRRAWVGSCMDMKGCIFVRFACGIACVWFVWLSRRWFTSTIRLKAHRPAPVRGIANQQPRHDVPHLLQTHKLHAATARPAPAPRIDTNNRSRPSPLPTHNMQDLSSARAFRVEHGWRVNECQCTSDEHGGLGESRRVPSARVTSARDYTPTCESIDSK